MKPSRPNTKTAERVSYDRPMDGTIHGMCSWGFAPAPQAD